jgi:precorrin isomerase
MAEDIRDEDTDQREVIERLKAEIVAEALRQEESCLYTSTAIYMWLRPVKVQHAIVVITPIALTALASFAYVKDVLPAWAVAVAALLSTLIPSLAKAMDFETHVSDLKSAAGEYKSLQDRFRQLAKIGILGNASAAEARLSELMERLDAVRAKSIVVPTKHFDAARAKIKNGDYDFSIDNTLRDAVISGGAQPMPPRS